MTIEKESQIKPFLKKIEDEDYKHLLDMSPRLVKWYQKNKRPLPWRVLWNQHSDPYHVWVSEVMLQQTIINVVIPKYHDFLEEFPSVHHLANAGEDDVKKAVRGLGYYRRFSMLHEGAKRVVGNSRGKKSIQWPTSFKAWKELPGVGDYTAAALSSITLDEAEAVVDGNVERVFCRLFDVRLPPNLPVLKKGFKKLGNFCIDRKYPGDFNQGIMELGQLICTPSDPSCDVCPVQKWCLARKNDSTVSAPAQKIKKDFVNLDLNLVIFQKQGKFGLLKRPKSAKFLKETNGFFTLLRQGKGFVPDGFQGTFKAHPKLKSLGAVSHSITNHRLKVQVSCGDHKQAPKGQKIEWLVASQVESRLIANLDRKAWKLFIKETMTP
ncbi:MAG: A/G-specific adenine glycosylase [Oligoflexales bacterium]|nr:A/G-specific adenine glycosylase [Oligoflexales bacterium]